jgi:uncharacterized protein (DUF58 family)
MIEKGKLNLDVAKSMFEFKSVMEDFRLKKGIYKISFKGRGLEFEGYKDFTPDDDAAEIDWKVSSRTQKLLVKQYNEERNLKILFLIDVGSNMVFGSTKKIKCEFAAELVLAFSNVILGSNDRVGFILFSEKINYFIECKGGIKHIEFLIDVLSKASNYGGITNLDGALDFALDSLDNSISSVILVSDFLNVTNETEKKLGFLSGRFETMALSIKDPLDVTLPDVDKEVILENPITKKQLLINPKIAKFNYEKYASEQIELVKKIFERTGTDYLNLNTEESFVIPLKTFLNNRVKGI